MCAAPCAGLRRALTCSCTHATRTRPRRPAFRRPPAVRGGSPKDRMRELGLVHHHLAERVELARRLDRLREEVGEVVRGADKGGGALWAVVPRGSGVCMYVRCMYVWAYSCIGAARSAARENVRCWCEICTKFAVVSPRNKKRNCSLTSNEILIHPKTVRPRGVVNAARYQRRCI